MIDRLVVPNGTNVIREWLLSRVLSVRPGVERVGEVVGVAVPVHEGPRWDLELSGREEHP